MTSPANKNHVSCCSVVSSSEGHLNYLNLMCQLNIQNWLCYPYPAKKAPLEKGNTGGRSLKHCVLHATGNSISVNTEVPRSASTSHPIASSTVHLQHIHLRFPIPSFQLFFPNSCCLICYIIKFCCSGKCTARCLLSWININAKANSAGTLPLPWSHLSW